VVVGGLLFFFSPSSKTLLGLRFTEEEQKRAVKCIL
jgi:hypothetical protein